MQVEGIFECLCFVGMLDDDICCLKVMCKIQICFIFKVFIDGVIIVFDLCVGMNIVKDNVVVKIQGMDLVWVSVVVLEFIVWLIKDVLQFSIQVFVWLGKIFCISKWIFFFSVDSVICILQLCLQVNNLDEVLKLGMNVYLQLISESVLMLLIFFKVLIDSGSEQ